MQHKHKHFAQLHKDSFTSWKNIFLNGSSYNFSVVESL